LSRFGAFLQGIVRTALAEKLAADERATHRSKCRVLEECSPIHGCLTALVAPNSVGA
jgi:hypothetical protein